jgi:GTP-binding protein
MKKYSNFRERNFVDKVKLTLKGGKGGNGCVTYYRDRKVRTGAPDGGSGGNGGNVYLKVAG